MMTVPFSAKQSQQPFSAAVGFAHEDSVLATGFAHEDSVLAVRWNHVPRGPRTHGI